jgi:hypothetical protein
MKYIGGDIVLNTLNVREPLTLDGNVPIYQNAQSVNADYTISDNTNAMSAGPITISTGVTVTVGTGETWTVV